MPANENNGKKKRESSPQRGWAWLLAPDGSFSTVKKETTRGIELSTTKAELISTRMRATNLGNQKDGKQSTDSSLNTRTNTGPPEYLGQIEYSGYG